MGSVRNRMACLMCLVVGLVWGFRSATPGIRVFAEDLPAVTPAVANPQPAKLPTSTPAEHLRFAAEHLEAAGQTGLAQHVRQLAEQTTSLNTARPPAYGPVAPPRVLPYYELTAPEWLPRPVIPPRGRVSIEVPPELDDGHLRYVQPVGRKFDAREIRTTAAPPRGPI